MTHTLSVKINGDSLGELSFDAALNLFDFQYSKAWLNRPDRFPLSEHIPLEPISGSNQAYQSAHIKQFFDNLLPEGQVLDDVTSMHQISKANLIAILGVLGSETSGALTIEGAAKQESLRKLPLTEISERIRSRPQQSFSIWDGKVRLSIAGFQDKIAALRLDNQWFLTEGSRYASTHILKPEPVSKVMRGMTSNEFFCMRLAKAIGLDVADVELIKVPEPVLVIARFDRHLTKDRVDRLHIIDGCQALGLPVSYKYERNFGLGKDVAQIREGASLPKLFELIERSTARPVLQRLVLLNWAVFQVLIGNIDAHAKNLSFRCSSTGLSLAPAYDLVSGVSFANDDLDKSYAMAIGDAFLEADLSPYEWASFAHACKLPFSVVSRALGQLSLKILKSIDGVASEVVEQGANEEIVQSIVGIVKNECQRQLEMAQQVKDVSVELFEEGESLALR